MTLRGLHATLVVAAASEPLSYESLAKLLRQSYGTTAIHAALLSDGRGSQRGLRLLKRVPGNDRKTRLLVPSRTGRAVARVFATVKQAEERGDLPIDEAARVGRDLEAGAIPALRIATQVVSDMYLATFCVLMFITQNNERFAHYGDPAAIIERHLKINNLPKHLSNLAMRSSDISNEGLIHLRKSQLDRRITLPELSNSGLTLVSNIAAALKGTSPSPVRRPKADSLRKASSADDVRKFNEDDFDIQNIDIIDDIDFGNK